MSDKSSKTKLNIEIETDTANLLKNYCSRKNKSESEVINEVLVSYLVHAIMFAE